jgi:hypothetical protein
MHNQAHKGLGIKPSVPVARALNRTAARKRSIAFKAKFFDCQAINR